MRRHLPGKILPALCALLALLTLASCAHAAPPGATTHSPTARFNRTDIKRRFMRCPFPKASRQRKQKPPAAGAAGYAMQLRR